MFVDQIAKFANMFYVAMQIDEMLPAESYHIYVKPRFSTAAWRHDGENHQIIIGSNIFKNLNRKLSPKEELRYLRSFLYHEFAHSIWTDRDLKLIHDILKNKEMSFKIFNLFEDARIEEKMRLHTKKLFLWLEYEELNIPENPLNMFYYLIQSEHKQELLLEVKNNMTHSQYAIFKTVFKYYKKVIDCESSFEVINIMQEWYDEYPLTPVYEESIQNNTYLFLEESELLGNDEKFDELVDGLDNILCINDTVVKGHKTPDASNTRSSNLLSSPVAQAFDIKKRDALLHIMKNIFTSPQRYMKTSIPSKRLNIKKNIQSSDKIFIKKSQVVSYKKKLTILLELSGSMHTTMHNMRLVVDVLDKMAQRNLIDATLILTAASQKEEFQILKMPLEENTVNKLSAHNAAEGLDNAMRKNLKSLSSSDYVWILTDGYIDDKPLQKDFYHKNHIFTHAMYIGDIDCSKEMQKSFDHVICEQSVEDLGKVILNLIL